MDEDTNCDSVVDLDQQLDDEFVDNQLEMKESEKTSSIHLDDALTKKLMDNQLNGTDSNINNDFNNESKNKLKDLNKLNEDLNLNDKSKVFDDHDNNQDKIESEKINHDNQNELTKKSGKRDHSVLIVHLLNGGKFECEVTVIRIFD